MRIPGIMVDADTAVALGLVVKELVTNGVKHAFPPRTGAVEVSARRRGDGRVELLVRDDGVGISEIKDGSLGQMIVASLVKQIGGDMPVHTDGGLAITITFPSLGPARPTPK